VCGEEDGGWGAGRFGRFCGEGKSSQGEGLGGEGLVLSFYQIYVVNELGESP
jgi:hypothetical protein